MGFYILVFYILSVAGSYFAIRYWLKKNKLKASFTEVTFVLFPVMNTITVFTFHDYITDRISKPKLNLEFITRLPNKFFKL